MCTIFVHPWTERVLRSKSIEFGSAGASWRALALKINRCTQYLKPQNQRVQKVMSQRSAGSCTHANAFPGMPQ